MQGVTESVTMHGKIYLWKFVSEQNSMKIVTLETLRLNDPNEKEHG